LKRVLVIGGFGYVGSALTLALSERFKVDTCDVGWFSRSSFSKDDHPTYDFDAWLLGGSTLDRYDGGIVYLAGRSSVGMCRAGTLLEAIHDNVFTFAQVLERVHPEQRFVYASSASVYGASYPPKVWREVDPLLRPVEVYDLTKQQCDGIALLSGKNVYGLRFGTVNGWSPRLRGDVMLNRMFLDARAKGGVLVKNPEIYRPILGMNDLCRAVRTILEAPEDRPGIYNLASFEAPVRVIGHEAARVLSVPLAIDEAPPSRSPYDMRMSVEKFEHAYGFAFLDTVETILRPLLARNFVVTSREGGPPLR
jgi:nucleoside-diphosphate-sugar epimerase